MLFCEKCKQSFGGEDSEFYPEACSKLPEPMRTTRCPACRVVGKLKWKSKEFKKIDAKFDFFFQCWRLANGNPLINISEHYHFPCPKCHGPGIETGITVYAEHYKCKDCDHSFSVK